MAIIPAKAKPTPKMAASGGAGVAAGLLVFIAQKFLKADMPLEVATAFVAAATWIGGWLKRDKSSPVPPAPKKGKSFHNIVTGP